jgi:hypothetical protein
MKVIGITGVARSGKDTLAKGIERFISENTDLSVKRYALARNLKADLYRFVMGNFGFSIYSPSEEQKALIRPLMVAYGCAQRVATKGKYWYNQVEQEITNDNPDIAIVTDIRFCEFEHDECHWLKQDMEGKLIHVARKSQDSQILPANIEEAVNDPKLLSMSDYRVIWDSMNDEDAYEYVKQFMTDHPELWNNS